MEGQTLSHYRVLEKLGGGGMGVVYKALDTRLNRHVALKFLPPELTRDDDARRRFILEAQAASALDHPNICTIHEIDATPENQQFIAMAFYEGETLKKRIEQGPLPVEEALDITIQIAEGLKKAHEAEIVHRDIKPANVMLTKDGFVKIVDFGIAKLLGVTGPTQTGTTLGTVSYMAPEQVAGEDADQQSDVWSLGTVLYEMLCGQQPFKGENHWAVMTAITNQEPEPPSTGHPEITAEVDRVVLRALTKPKGSRYPSAAEFLLALRTVRGHTLDVTRGVAAPPRVGSRRVAVAAAAFTLVVGGLGLLWLANRGSDAQWAREQAIPQALELASRGEYSAAFTLVREAEAIVPDDPSLATLLSQVALPISLQSSPPGAEVYVRDYSDADSEARFVGTTPLVDTPVSMGAKRWDLRLDGFHSVTLAAPPDYWQFSAEIRGFDGVVLDEQGTLPENMVRVPGGQVLAWLTGIDPYSNLAAIDDFLMDKYEVTNAQYKAFIDAGGYGNRQYWLHEFSEEGRAITWDEAMARFVDATGRPGPSTWELGDYPEGHGDYPVTGISWYEAAAHAEFAGKQLPTVLQWVRAAETRLFSFLLPISNLDATAPVGVGTRDAISTFGVHDMAGNAREWCLNASGDGRFILGGGWSDPSYLFTYANVQSAFNRSEINGFRLVRRVDTDGPAEMAAAPIEPLTRDYLEEQPVSDEVFQIYQEQFAYDQTPLNAVVETLPSSSDDWAGERVELDAAYGNERLITDVYLPVGFSPPYQAVIVFPGTNAIFEPVNPQPGFWDDFIPRSGRALVKPVIKGTFERRDGLLSTWPDESVRYTDYLVSWVKDFKRTIDYLATRGDIDVTRLAYYGLSWGGRKGAIVPAVEDRFRASILYSGGFASGRARPEVDQINYVSRVTIPTLMLNGLYDPLEPVDAAQRPMFQLLGTPEPDKRWVQYEIGHVLPRNEVIRESLDWLDKYLGPVN